MSGKNRGVQPVIRILLIIYTIVILYPLLWNVMSSFKTNYEILVSLTAFPQGLAWENYVRAFTVANMGAFMFNSIFVVVLSLFFLLVFSIPLSYAMARYNFFGSRALELLFAMCLFVQGVYIIIPLYVLLFNLGMLDNLIALSLVYAATGIPFSSFLLAGYMRTVHRSYEEAAKIDGCTNWQILFRIVAPMSKPGIITISMLNVMGFWNEYPMALVFLSSPSNRTLPIGVANLFEVQRRATDFGALYAALMIVLVPTVIIYLIGQRHLIKGIGVGGIKE
jgi:N-acetylglucosamine transport system permease protein